MGEVNWREIAGNATEKEELEAKAEGKELKKKAPEVEEKIKKMKGVVDTFDGMLATGNGLNLRVRHADAERFGLTAESVAAALHTALLGQAASSVLEGDRVVAIRVLVDKSRIATLAEIRDLPILAPGGFGVKLSQVAEVTEEPGQIELRREDLRQLVAVSARLEGRDLGGAMNEIRQELSKDSSLKPGMVEFGGLYQQQQESFKNLIFVLLMAIFLVFTVLLLEFRSFAEPVAIVFGAVLTLFGTVLALWITGTSLNIVSFLGAIIGVGIVAKNGILMLDFLRQHFKNERGPFPEVFFVISPVASDQHVRIIEGLAARDLELHLGHEGLTAFSPQAFTQFTVDVPDNSVVIVAWPSQGIDVAANVLVSDLRELFAFEVVLD